MPLRSKRLNDPFHPQKDASKPRFIPHLGRNALRLNDSAWSDPDIARSDIALRDHDPAQPCHAERADQSAHRC